MCHIRSRPNGFAERCSRERESGDYSTLNYLNLNYSTLNNWVLNNLAIFAKTDIDESIYYNGGIYLQRVFL